MTSVDRGRVLCTDPAQLVTQVFAPACSVSRGPRDQVQLWEPLASAVLRAAYEATLWAALSSAQRRWGRGGSTRVLTMVGGGGFGNPVAWICDAMDAALWKFRGRVCGWRLRCTASQCRQSCRQCCCATRSQRIASCGRLVSGTNVTVSSNLVLACL